MTSAAECYVQSCSQADIVAGAAVGGQVRRLHRSSPLIRQLCAAIGVSLSTPAAAASILSAATASGARPAASTSAIITNSAAASSVRQSLTPSL